MFWPIFIAAATFWGLALGGAVWFARRYLRALEARTADQTRIGELERRIAALESGDRPPPLPPGPPPA